MPSSLSSTTAENDNFSSSRCMQLTHPEATSSSELHRIGLRVGLNAVQIHTPDFLVRLPARTQSRDSERDSCSCRVTF